MFGLFKKNTNRFVVIDMNDYLIKAILMNGDRLEDAAIFQAPLETGVFEGDLLIDELAFYDSMKQLIDEWGLKRTVARFFVPESTVMMKSFEHPKELQSSELKSFVEMELGRTIHLPYSLPLIDVYDFKEGDEEATLFAAPSEEIVKLAGLFEDLSLHPTVADIRALAAIRFFEETNSMEKTKTYLIIEWSITGVSISIYSGGKIEFLRYQGLETNQSEWEISNQRDEWTYEYKGNKDEYRGQLIDQIAEVDRILNFYRFSLYKGEKAVDELLIFGSSPEMDYIYGEMAANFTTPIQYFNDAEVKKTYPNFTASDIPLIGLIFREV